MRWLSLPLAFLTALTLAALGPACTDDDRGSGEELAGSSCNYLCLGQSCNYRCEDEVLYRCTQDEEWIFVQDCAAAGLVCKLDDPDSEAGVYDCVDP